MKARLLIAGLMLCGLVASISSVSAYEPLPKLRLPEKAALILIEGLFRAASSVIAFQGCATTGGIYDLTLETYFDGSGFGTLDGLTLNVRESSSSFKGQIFELTDAGDGRIDNIEIPDYLGLHGVDRAGSMFYGDANLLISVIPYDEHGIEDGWISPALNTSWEGRGIYRFYGQSTTGKLNYPRAKWEHSGTYWPPWLEDGRISITQVRTGPVIGPPCVMTYTAEIDDFGEGFQAYRGLLTIYQ